MNINDEKVISGQYLKIECPTCKTILIVERSNGKVIEVRKPLVENPSGDRFNDAFEKLKNSKKEIEDKFNASLKNVKSPKRSLDDLLK